MLEVKKKKRLKSTVNTNMFGLICLLLGRVLKSTTGTITPSIIWCFTVKQVHILYIFIRKYIFI